MLELAACVILPFVPLLLMKYPLERLAAGLFRMLSGQ